MTRPRHHLVAPMLVLASVLVMSACGTRLDHQEVVAAAGGGGVGSSATGGAADGTGGNGNPGGAGTTGTGAKGGSVTSGSTGAGGTAVSGATGGPTGTGATGGSSGGSGATTGATGSTAGGGDTTPVVLGQVGTFSGIVGASEGTAQAMTSVWVKWTNAHGGLAGHPIKLFSFDDGGDANKAKSIVKDLVESKKAAAILGAFVPLTVQSVAGYLDQAKVAAVGGDVTSPDWNRHPYLFSMGASSEALSVNIAQAMAQKGQKKAAVFYCAESASCSAAVTALDKGATKFGVDVVYKAQVSLAQPDFTAQCSQANSRGAQAIFVGAGGDDIIRAARDCRKIPNFKPALYGSGLAVTDALASDPNLEGLATTASVFPWMQSSTPAERDYQAAIKQYAPNLTPAGANAQAWASGQLLLAAVNALGSAAKSGPITPKLITQGLWKLKGETMGGLAPKLSFIQGKPAPLVTCTFFAQIVHSRWTAPDGDKLSCY
jgi:branched-chain amino acid transport system substrate-binding protein